MDISPWLLSMILVQGISEAFPISSSVHLMILQRLWGVENQQNVALDVALHLGSFLAFLVVFWPKILEFFQEGLKGSKMLFSPGVSWGNFFSFFLSTKFLSLFVACLPVALAGFFFTMFPQYHHYGRRPSWGAWNSIIFGFLLFLTHWAPASLPLKSFPSKAQSFFIGIFQVFSLIPGASRLGCCLTASRFLGFSIQDSISYGFLLGLGALGGGLLLKYKDILALCGQPMFFPMVGGTFCVSLPLVYLFSTWIKGLWIFGIYRMMLGFLLLFLL